MIKASRETNTSTIGRGHQKNNKPLNIMLFSYSKDHQAKRIMLAHEAIVQHRILIHVLCQWGPASTTPSISPTDQLCIHQHKMPPKKLPKPIKPEPAPAPAPEPASPPPVRVLVVKQCQYDTIRGGRVDTTPPHLLPMNEYGDLTNETEWNVSLHYSPSHPHDPQANSN